MTILHATTPPEWLFVALADLPAILNDHAHCEKKAAAQAMALVSRYPHEPELVLRATALAQEELRHFVQVYKHLQARGLQLGPDPGDPYAKALFGCVGQGRAALLDRLLIAALIEARSAERLQLLAGGLQETDLATFYGRLAKAEQGHFKLFIRLAVKLFGHQSTQDRLVPLAVFESEVISQLPVLPRIH